MIDKDDDDDEFFDGDPEDLPEEDDDHADPIRLPVANTSSNAVATIASLLDVEPPTSIIARTEEDDKLSDIDFARKKIRDTITLGESSLKEMMDLAQSSQHPRAFEVAVQMFGQLVDANKKLLETVHVDKKTKLASAPKGGPDVNTPAITNNTTNNVVMVGSTNDAIEMVRRKREAAAARIIDNDEEAP